MSAQNVCFRAAGGLDGQLAARGEVLGSVARRDLERAYAVLRAELDRLDLSEAEASLVCDACNGTLFDATNLRLLWAEVADAIRLDHLDAKWGVDGHALVERLRSLSPAQTWALVDAVERYWRAPEQPIREGLARVGLLRETAA